MVMKQVDKVEVTEDGLKVSTGIGYGGSEETMYEHESYGMLHIHRVTCNGETLFGSSIAKHSNMIRIKVSTGRRHHDLSRDWYYSRNDALIEIDLTPAQFAEAITSLNAGGGTPCTLRAVDGSMKSRPPSTVPLEADKVRADFKADFRKAAEELQAARDEAQKLLTEKASISKKDRELLIGMFDRALMGIRSNMPFVLSQFEEAAEKVVVAAKAEIEATVQSNLTVEGLRAMLARVEANSPPQLETVPVKLELPVSKDPDVG